MNASNRKTFLAYPIALIAAIVDWAKIFGNADYEMASQHVVNCYNNLENRGVISICDSPYFEMMSQEELDSLLSYVYSKLGIVQSFTVRKFNNETSVYKLECTNGFFKMIFVVDGDNRITAIDFVEEKESFQMNKAA